MTSPSTPSSFPSLPLNITSKPLPKTIDASFHKRQYGKEQKEENKREKRWAPWGGSRKEIRIAGREAKGGEEVTRQSCLGPLTKRT